jgi:hypothetical protein
VRVARSSGVSPPQLVVAQDRFYDHLYDDLADAREQVVIYSPFATADRVGQLEPHLRAAIERGVGVWVITKTLEERSSPFSSGSSEASHASCSSTVRAATPLCRWGEAVLIDSQVLWQGLLNPLSFSATQEIMERQVSREIVRGYASVLRLNDLLATYRNSETECPYCGGELVAAEGRDEPVYWRCVVDD